MFVERSKPRHKDHNNNITYIHMCKILYIMQIYIYYIILIQYHGTDGGRAVATGRVISPAGTSGI